MNGQPGKKWSPPSLSRHYEDSLILLITILWVTRHEILRHLCLFPLSLLINYLINCQFLLSLLPCYSYIYYASCNSLVLLLVQGSKINHLLFHYHPIKMLNFHLKCSFKVFTQNISYFYWFPITKLIATP